MKIKKHNKVTEDLKNIQIPPILIDRNRMEDSLNSIMHEIPRNLSREEKRKLITDIAKKVKNNI